MDPGKEQSKELSNTQLVSRSKPAGGKALLQSLFLQHSDTQTERKITIPAAAVVPPGTGTTRDGRKVVQCNKHYTCRHMTDNAMALLGLGFDHVQKVSCSMSDDMAIRNGALVGTRHLSWLTNPGKIPRCLLMQVRYVSARRKTRTSELRQQNS